MRDRDALADAGPIRGSQHGCSWALHCLSACLVLLGCSNELGDARQASEVCLFLREQFNVPGVFWSVEADLTLVFVYEVMDGALQDKMVEALVSERTRRGWRPILVRFHERRVREIEPSGAIVNGREKLLRTERIE